MVIGNILFNSAYVHW